MVTLTSEQVESLDVILRWLVSTRDDVFGPSAEEQDLLRTAARDLAGAIVHTHPNRVRPVDVDRNWRVLISAKMHQEHDDECAACMELNTRCPFHEGIDKGVELASKALAVLADDPDQFNAVLAAGDEDD